MLLVYHLNNQVDLHLTFHLDLLAIRNHQPNIHNLYYLPMHDNLYQLIMDLSLELEEVAE